MNASILAIGTELTTGQIINKNAATLSAKLKPFGLKTNIHLTVPDDRKIILDSLSYLVTQSEILFITGGLGPTSDDFTREVISEWAELKLQFDDQSWQHINERLSARDYAIRDIQKQQCYFPTGAKILTNADGTAHGFQFSLKRNGVQKIIFVLPGPPREIDRIWKDHIHHWLAENTKNLPKSVTKAWDTLSLGESDVALLVEKALQDKPSSIFFEIGYRVHLPYVEVKMTFQESDAKFLEKSIQQIDEALQAITVSRDFADAAEQVSRAIKNIDFTFYDYASEGYLHTRLSPFLRGLKKWSFKQSYGRDISADFFENEDQFLALFPFEEDKCVAVFSINGHRYLKHIEAPMKSPLMAERRRQYFAEMALVEVMKGLS